MNGVESPVEFAGGAEPLMEPGAIAPRPVRFSRKIATPPAAPWRQRQMANLDARLGAPLAIEQLSYRLERGAPWCAGQPGLFVAVYVRKSASRSSWTARDEANGTDGSIAFRSGRISTHRLELALVTLFAVSAVALSLMAGSSAISLRHTRFERLDLLEQQAQLASHRAYMFSQRRTIAKRLTAAGATEQSPRRLLEDLSWVSAHKRRAVSVRAFHWLRGVAAIEVDSSNSPFINADRPIQRASRPVGPGLWLWGSSHGFQPPSPR